MKSDISLRLPIFVFAIHGSRIVLWNCLRRSMSAETFKNSSCFETISSNKTYFSVNSENGLCFNQDKNIGKALELPWWGGHADDMWKCARGSHLHYIQRKQIIRWLHGVNQLEATLKHWTSSCFSILQKSRLLHLQPVLLQRAMELGPQLEDGDSGPAVHQRTIFQHLLEAFIGAQLSKLSVLSKVRLSRI